MRVALAIGHAGKPSKPMDRGAAFGGLSEYRLSLEYALHIESTLHKNGHSVFILHDGEYSERARRANDYGADCFLACHMNAGGGNRGEVFHDYSSIRGKALASGVANALGALPWKTTAKECRPDTNGKPRDSDYSEAYACIVGTKMPAIVLEPQFIDGPGIHSFVKEIDIVGHMVALAIMDWHNESA